MTRTVVTSRFRDSRWRYADDSQQLSFGKPVHRICFPIPQTRILLLGYYIRGPYLRQDRHSRRRLAPERKPE